MPAVTSNSDSGTAGHSFSSVSLSWSCKTKLKITSVSPAQSVRSLSVNDGGSIQGSFAFLWLHSSTVILWLFSGSLISCSLKFTCISILVFNRLIRNSYIAIVKRQLNKAEDTLEPKRNPDKRYCLRPFLDGDFFERKCGANVESILFRNHTAKNAEHK